ncbi:hypothetical protein [Paenibacillus sp. FSL R7-0333]|uniref:hypothetical protein n=1 Tax=Paenibacillus sp. FSL R7-0333 TaxID=1926587 RepID=UPI00117F9599
MTIFWISNRNDFADFTEQPDMVEKPITFGAAEVCGPDMVEKPTTFGAAKVCGPDMVEKPTTFGAAEACGPDMIEKPITMGMSQAFCSGIMEKIITLAVLVINGFFLETFILCLHLSDFVPYEVL